MKNLVTILALLLIVVICFSVTSYAKGKKLQSTNGVRDGGVVADVWQIPKASTPPLIDGEADDIWWNVAAVPNRKVECSLTGRTSDSLSERAWDDFAVTTRVMWDADNLYLFINVVDDTLFASRTDQPWMNDNIELFFDGGNEKATTYDDNDLQIHWNYGETVESHPITASSIGNWVWAETNSGYNWEIAIPNAELVKGGNPLFAYEADKEIGFEVSVGDEETVNSPQFNLHWWTNNNLTWQQPNTFGTAVLSSIEVTPTYEIVHAGAAVNIDGEMTDGEGWENAAELTNNKYEQASPGDLYPLKAREDSWRDFYVQSWTMWDESNLYFFMKVVDDTLFAARTDQPWMNDNLELFFDGGNEKATSYDDNDLQVHWNYGETPESHPITSGSIGNWVWVETDLGYNFEMAIPNTELVKGGNPLFAYEADKEIGYEISVGDEETALSTPQKNLHWWTTNNLTWQQPNTFGTALLVTSRGVGIENQPSNVVTNYTLEQNYPNPFNPTTQITYTIPKSEKVKLTVYNVLGNQVAVLVDQTQGAGTYTKTFNAQGLASGIYFYKLETGSKSMAKKMMLIK
jgi:hypothetical protein